MQIAESVTRYCAVTYQLHNHVATITFDRPNEMNPLGPDMRRDLMAALESATADQQVRVIVLTGSGRAFGSGQDLSSEADMRRGAVDLIENDLRPLLMRIQESPKPVICAINGACAGVSIAVALACDLAVMADNSFLYFAFGAVGLIPDGGVSWHLVRQVGFKKAYQLIAEAARLGAEEALALGLVNKVVPADELIAKTQFWAESLSVLAPLSLRYTKDALRAASVTDLSETLSIEAKLQEICSASEDFHNARGAFMKKEAAVFKGR